MHHPDRDEVAQAAQDRHQTCDEQDPHVSFPSASTGRACRTRVCSPRQPLSNRHRTATGTGCPRAGAAGPAGRTAACLAPHRRWAGPAPVGPGRRACARRLRAAGGSAEPAVRTRVGRQRPRGPARRRQPACRAASSRGAGAPHPHSTATAAAARSVRTGKRRRIRRWGRGRLGRITRWLRSVRRADPAGPCSSRLRAGRRVR